MYIICVINTKHKITLFYVYIIRSTYRHKHTYLNEMYGTNEHKNSILQKAFKHGQSTLIIKYMNNVYS